ncbi:MAG: peptidyl-tRNA hydrolase Pth2 [Candidatus Aenigmatarchaeota archaeon]
MKQAIIVRTDLRMGKGKIASQVAHASIASFLKSRYKKRWIDEGMKKIILKVSSLRELKSLHKQAKKEKLPCELIRDMGLTQIKPGSITCLGIGPASDKKIDKITSKLRLL